MSLLDSVWLFWARSWGLDAAVWCWLAVRVGVGLPVGLVVGFVGFGALQFDGFGWIVFGWISWLF